MPAAVTFNCVRGPLKGQGFKYKERASFLIGRADDCVIKIPRTEETLEVSRHHCLVEICPPLARIRDFGSLNGTFVNGECIGARAPSKKAGEVSPASVQHDLSNGDTIRLATLVFLVKITACEYCEECRNEIPEKDKSRVREDVNRYVCDVCRAARENGQKRREQQAKDREIQRQAEQARKQEQDRRAEQARKQEQKAEAARRSVKVLDEARKKVQQAKAQTPKKNAPPASPPGLGKPDPTALVQALLERARQGAPEVRNVKGYAILKTIGIGGMGAVYLAHREKTGQEVALKVMLPKVAANKDAVARFRREMENAKVLRHPNVVHTYETGYHNNIFYMTMEFCNGGSVQDLLQKHGGRLPFDLAVDVIRQACDGIDYMHKASLPYVRLVTGSYGKGRGLVHRDLKPGNLFLKQTDSGLKVKVADLGMAKAFDQAGLSGLTMTGQAGGSPPFMSRQQVVNYLFAKPEVDVWAIAAVFYNFLTGMYPRDFPPGKDVWLNILQSDPVPIRKRNPSVPKKLAKVIDKALVDKPRIGFSSIAAFRREVSKAL